MLKRLICTANLQAKEPVIPWPYSNWWLVSDISESNCVAAFQPIGSPTQASSYLNLANRGTYDASPATSITWDSLYGWHTASSQYLTTGINAGQNWSMFAQISRCTSGGLCGTDASTNRRFYLWPRWGNTNIVYSGGGLVIGSSAMTDGNLGISGHQGYLNGVADGSTTAAYAGNPAWPLLIGAIASAANGSASSFFTGDIVAMAIYNITLDSRQVSELVTRMSLIQSIYRKTIQVTDSNIFVSPYNWRTV